MQKLVILRLYPFNDDTSFSAKILISENEWVMANEKKQLFMTRIQQMAENVWAELQKYES